MGSEGVERPFRTTIVEAPLALEVAKQAVFCALLAIHRHARRRMIEKASAALAWG
jgi:hypothetical protein